ncbi:MAG: sulfide/dihydroorotate dehydrogenase-like FAD/NAD-binding protein [Candidatus Saganbacteria bacterium]|nr:sulfide/dihydroorotate dehydrogenase-like FAD/NAD-binding protein [Candidatus Saganbacteria bacterium]
MYKIIEVKQLAPKIKQLKVLAPDAAKAAKPGQFAVIRINENGERIPLTVADADRSLGEITIIFQEVGATTSLLGTLKKGDFVRDLLCPLGKPADIEKFGTVVTIGGGVGIPEILPVTKAYKKAGNHVISVLGARNKELILLEDEIRKASDETLVCTDDGSYGKKGFVSDILKEIIEKNKVDLVSAVGPTIMMKVVAGVTRPHNIKTLVSLNPIMLDATGMCGVCRVTVGGQVKFACVDGPEFDGHLVDFDELMTRQKIYVEEEKEANHKCRIM